MNALWNSLIEPVYVKLCELGIAPGSPLLLLPQGGLWLLALHAASRPVDGVQRAFADDFVITYTPSIYARKICLSRSVDREDEPPSLLAVINPSGDLPYAEKEVALISHHFKTPFCSLGKRPRSKMCAPWSGVPATCTFPVMGSMTGLTPCSPACSLHRQTTCCSPRFWRSSR